MPYVLNEQECRNLEVSTRREWVLPNGIGGYAMGTASGINTRRYHGHLVAATTPPTARVLLLASIDAEVRPAGEVGGNPTGISANQYPGAIHPEGFHYLRSFAVGRVAVWRYRVAGCEIEKRLAVHPAQNAATIVYRNVGPAPFELFLRPLVAHRDHHANFVERADYPEALRLDADGVAVEHAGVSLYLSHFGATREPVGAWYFRFEHAREMERGLDPRDDLFCPCELRYTLAAGEETILVASTEPGVAAIDTTETQGALVGLGGRLREAASLFVVSSSDRASILAGYPWFTDWGRDTMIALPGICLATGRVAEARRILRDYAGQMRRGLIPNRFVERGEEPEYNTADATLWFANAVYATLRAEWDEAFAREMLGHLREIRREHEEGTLFGIRVDPADGLLAQGAPGLQLTWMDAKIGDWVVTPRAGKAVEIAALWINLLRVVAEIAGRLGEGDRGANEAAEGASGAFEQKFWDAERGHYRDTVEPDDPTLRPNQVIAMALPFSPCAPDHARGALGVVARELLTRAGLRTLGPSEPGYRGRFEGPMYERDAAYHQGTAWPWLLGPYATALARFGDGPKEAKRVLRGARSMLEEYGLGGIAEVYDGDEPQSPGGCPWQAWSVAEILRAWIELGGE